MATSKQLIRVMCLKCLSASSGHSAYDCASHLCALYAAHPFRGKAKPAMYGATSAYEERLISAAHSKTAKRWPSKSIINRFCRECQPESRAKCNESACPINPMTPFQAGGQPKRTRPFNPACVESSCRGS